MTLEKQLNPIKKELDILVDSNKTTIENQKGYIEVLIKASAEFDTNWVGTWASKNFNQYKNFIDKSGGNIAIDDKFMLGHIEKKTGLDLKKIKETISSISKLHRDFQEKILTELSVIKDKVNLQQEVEILEKLEQHSWGTSPWKFVKRRRPESIMTYNAAAILNKGSLDTPPHIKVGAELTSLYSILAAIEDFQKNSKRLIRQLEIKLSIDLSSPDKSDFIIKVIEKFHTVAKQLLNRHSKRNTIEINDEYDVQDLFHGLLRLEFEDVRAEEYTPSYAGSSTRMDFLLKKEKIVIEVKKTRENLKDKEVGDQLIIDTQHYKAHIDCKRLICFIYDPESRIKNPRGLETDLNAITNDDLIVEVYIRP